MADETNSKEQLLNELEILRQRVAELETLQTERNQAEVKREMLLAAEREQRALTEALYWAGAVLSSTLSYDKVLDHIMEQIGRVASYKAACIMIIEGKTARIFRWQGYENFEIGNPIAAVPFNIQDISTLRTIRETGWPLVTPFVTEYNDWPGMAGQVWIKSSITVPIRTRNRLIGFLHADNDVPGFYSYADAERLHTFANQAAIALENARLYDRARREIADRVKELKEERNFVSTIIDTVGALVIVLDAEGRIVRFNRACEQLTGYLANEIQGRLLWEILIPVEELELVEHVLTELKAGQLPINHETHLRTKNDDKRLIAWTNTRLLSNDDERVEYIISTGMDITQRRQSERERERLIEELEAFAHTVAHDLQEPLTGIIGAADSLLRYSSTMSSQELQQYLQVIARSSRKMSNIIDELLLLAGVRKEKIQVKPLAMGTVVDEALNRLSYLIKERQVEIIKAKDWPVALGYAPWVEEVWVNYISNAIKYGGTPPKIELGGSVYERGMVMFWVRDNGPGLTTEEQSRLFFPFTRISQIRAKGHGLGLSIVQRIIERLNGFVKVESEGISGKGCTFCFMLPDMLEVQQN